MQNPNRTRTMCRRFAIQLRILASTRAASRRIQSHVGSSACPESLRRSFPILSRHFSAVSSNVTKRVEDVVPIATGHEREELEAELKGKDILEINYPAGPFGTKEEPAVIKSYYDKRIVGCPGGEGEDEHDVVWFWLEKGKPHECPVCSQYFVNHRYGKPCPAEAADKLEDSRKCTVLEVVGPGGPPDGHGDEDDHHH